MRTPFTSLVTSFSKNCVKDLRISNGIKGSVLRAMNRQVKDVSTVAFLVTRKTNVRSKCQ